MLVPSSSDIASGPSESRGQKIGFKHPEIPKQNEEASLARTELYHRVGRWLRTVSEHPQRDHVHILNPRYSAVLLPPLLECYGFCPNLFPKLPGRFAAKL
jgi:hypothetical protein